MTSDAITSACLLHIADYHGAADVQELQQRAERGKWRWRPYSADATKIDILTQKEKEDEHRP